MSNKARFKALITLGIFVSSLIGVVTFTLLTPDSTERYEYEKYQNEFLAKIDAFKEKKDWVNSELRGTKWILEEIVMNAGKKTPKGVTIEFADSGIGGKAICNHYGGYYNAINSTKTVSMLPTWSTFVGCGGNGMADEMLFLDLLGMAQDYKIQDNRLTVRSKNNVTLVFMRN